MRANGNRMILLIVLLVGAIFGSIIGNALNDVFPILNFGKSIGVEPFVVDLNAIVFTFGLTLSLNVAGILGIIIAFWVYRRL